MPQSPLTGSKKTALFLVVCIVLGGIVGATTTSFLSNSVNVSGGVTFAAPSGPAVNLAGDADVNATNVFTASDTVTLNTSGGNVTVQSTGPANATIHVSEINGTWTNTTQLDVASNTITVTPEDKAKLGIGGDADAVAWQDYAVDDGTTDVVYRGSSGNTTLVFYGLPDNTTIGVVDTLNNTLVGHNTTTRQGVLRVNVTNSGHTVSLQTSENPPELTNPHPTGRQSTRPETLNVTVEDDDFSDGDEVELEARIDGQSLGNKTVTSQQEVSWDIPGGLSSGQHNWSVVATDGFGNQDVENYTFTVPDKLYIYNATNTSELVTKNTTVEIYVADNDTVITRYSGSDGIVNMSGLPVYKDLVIVADADGYYKRHTVIEDLAVEQSVYLLNSTTADTVEVTFLIDDNTGEFPPEETTVYVQKAITKNNETKFRTVAADTAGVAGFTTRLEKDVRYRLKVKNTQDQVRVLGSYTPTKSETVTLSIGKVEWQAPDGETWRWESFLTESGDAIQFQFQDNQTQTSDWWLRIWTEGNESSPFYTDREDSLGVYEATIPLSASQQNQTIIVNMTFTRDNHQISKQVKLGRVKHLGFPIDEKWATPIGLIFLVGLAAATPASISRTGAIGITAIAFGMTWFGLVAIPMPAIGIMGALALLGKVRDLGGVY